MKYEQSAKAFTVALKYRYSNNYWFRGEFEEWLSKSWALLAGITRPRIEEDQNIAHAKAKKP
ncbi:MAG: hypothetical protein GXP17_06040 [Gammaproteobacteria bacterium]|nr:hypothetical protein [Gammaproteobacteria bacterium]